MRSVEVFCDMCRCTKHFTIVVVVYQCHIPGNEWVGAHSYVGELQVVPMKLNLKGFRDSCVIGVSQLPRFSQYSAQNGGTDVSVYDVRGLYALDLSSDHALPTILH